MDNRSRPFMNAIILVVIMSVFLSILGLTNEQGKVNAQSTNTESTRTISVSGSGEVQTQPDLAIIDVGVQTEDESAQSALDENNTRTEALMDALDGAGIPEENIQTTRFQLIPNYRYDNENDTQTLIGYSVSNIVQVQTNDLDALGVLLDLAVDAGANTIQNIRFEVSDPESIANQAREAAVEDARNKAEQLAKLTGSALGIVMSIHETSSNPVPVERPAFAAEAAGVPIEPGGYRLNISVEITWMLTNSTALVPTSPSVNISPQFGKPGSLVQVNATGFPATTRVEIGVGHWGSEYEVVKTVKTDSNGALSDQVEIPDTAEVDEEWVVVVAVDNLNPDRLKVTSNRFSVTD